MHSARSGRENLKTEIWGRDDNTKGMAFKQTGGSYNQRRNSDTYIIQKRRETQKKASFSNYECKASSHRGRAHLEGSNRLDREAVDNDKHSTKAGKRGGKEKELDNNETNEEIGSSRHRVVRKQGGPNKTDSDWHKKQDSEETTLENIHTNRVSTVLSQRRKNDEVWGFRGSRGHPRMQRGDKQRKGNDESLEDAGFQSSIGSALEKRAVTRGKAIQEEEKLSDTTVAKNKRNFLDKSRDAEYKMYYDESEDDAPCSDARVRAVQQRQREIRHNQKQDAKNSLEHMKYKEDSDSDGDCDEWFWEFGLKKKPAMINHEGSEESENGSKSSGDKSDPDIPDPERDANYKRDSDEDEWFWDAPRWRPGTQKILDSDKNVGSKLELLGTRTRNRILRNTMHDELKHSIENAQLVDFKRDFSQSLIDPHRRSESSSTKSSSNSSSSCSEVSLSSAADNNIKYSEINHRRNASVYSIPGHSSDASKSTIYTCRQETAAQVHHKEKRNRKPNTSTVNTARNEAQVHHWDVPDESRESSITSRSTSSSDSRTSSDSETSSGSERSSGSHNSADSYLNPTQ